MKIEFPFKNRKISKEVMQLLLDELSTATQIKGSIQKIVKCKSFKACDATIFVDKISTKTVLNLEFYQKNNQKYLAEKSEVL